MSQAVNGMFDRIAPTYDALNRVLSLGIDQSWRRRAVRELGPVASQPVLDLCAGTLDLTRIAQAAGAQVVASDFAQAMLERGRDKLGSAIPLVRADAQKLPFSDASFAGVLCGFGLRNLDDPLAGLREMRRVLRPGGRLVVLDFFRPRRALTRAVQVIYNRRVLPLVGGMISGDASAYRYLARSIERFSTLEEAEAIALHAGFDRVRGIDLTVGVAALLIGEVSA